MSDYPAEDPHANDLERLLEDPKGYWDAQYEQAFREIRAERRQLRRGRRRKRLWRLLRR